MFYTYLTHRLYPNAGTPTSCQRRANCQAGDVIRLLAVGTFPDQSLRLSARQYGRPALARFNGGDTVDLGGKIKIEGGATYINPLLRKEVGLIAHCLCLVPQLIIFCEVSHLLFETGRNCEVDVDECATNFYNCRSNSTCVNTEGGYNCQCQEGYRYGINIKCISPKRIQLEENAFGVCMYLFFCAVVVGHNLSCYCRGLNAFL